MTDTHGYSCPYPGCKWSMVIEVGMTHNRLNRILVQHCNTSHPGWTLLEIQQMFERRQRQLKLGLG